MLSTQGITLCPVPYKNKERARRQNVFHTKRETLGVCLETLVSLVFPLSHQKNIKELNPTLNGI